MNYKLTWTHSATWSKATAKDGTTWTITGCPGYAGSPGAVTLTSRTPGGVQLHSHHLDWHSARQFAEEH